MPQIGGEREAECWEISGIRYERKPLLAVGFVQRSGIHKLHGVRSAANSAAARPCIQKPSTPPSGAGDAAQSARKLFPLTSIEMRQQRARENKAGSFRKLPGWQQKVGKDLRNRKELRAAVQWCHHHWMFRQLKARVHQLVSPPAGLLASLDIRIE